MLKTLTAALVVALVAGKAGAGALVVTDAEFAPVAEALAGLYQSHGGPKIRVESRAKADLAPGADIVLGPDEALARDLVAAGLALGDSRVTYAMGLTGTAAATLPRDAVLMQQAAGNTTARDFFGFLLTPEAWDVIVAGGYGAQ